MRCCGQLAIVQGYGTGKAARGPNVADTLLALLVKPVRVVRKRFVNGHSSVGSSLVGGRQRDCNAKRVFRFGFCAGQLDGDFRVHRNVLTDTFRE